MDYFGIATDRLVTTGVGSCICFVVILNSADDQKVFIEHRSDAYFPSFLTLNNVRLCFKNVAKHINQLLPEHDIKAVLIFGGTRTKKRHINHQENINKLIQAGVNENDKTESRLYKQLLKNIIYKNVCFNLGTKSDILEKTTSSDSIDVFINKDMGRGKGGRMVVVVKRIKKIRISDILVGVLAIGIGTENRWFAIDESAMNNNQNKTKQEQDFWIKMAEHFQSHAKNLGALEVKGIRALHLLNYGSYISEKSNHKNSEGQIRLNANDQKMYENRTTPTQSSVQIISRDLVNGNHRLMVRNGNQFFLVTCGEPSTTNDHN